MTDSIGETLGVVMLIVVFCGPFPEDEDVMIEQMGKTENMMARETAESQLVQVPTEQHAWCGLHIGHTHAQ